MFWKNEEQLFLLPNENLNQTITAIDMNFNWAAWNRFQHPSVSVIIFLTSSPGVSW